MRVVFRVDSSARIGLGHLTRCLALARALQESGCSITFICQNEAGNVNHFIEESGFDLVQINTSAERGNASGDRYASFDWFNDATLFLSNTIEFRPDWIIIDHYSIGFDWQVFVGRKLPESRIMVIDDVPNRRHNCNLILDQTFERNADAYTHLVPKDCKVICGSKYMLLRSEFALNSFCSFEKRLNRPIYSLLITMGGTDIANVTTRILDIVEKSSFPVSYPIRILLGPTAPWLNEIRSKIAISRRNIELHINPPDLVALLEQSDLAIGAAGSSAWERCCLGLPTILVTVADNQRAIAESLHRFGAAIAVGDPHDAGFNFALSSAISKMLNDAAALNLLKLRASAVTDGHGAARVAQLLNAMRTL